MKHFKFLSVLVMTVLAIVIVIGWNRAQPASLTNERFPRQGGERSTNPGAGGIHPNLEPKTAGGKKPCGVCQQKAVGGNSGRRTESFKPKQKFI